MTLKKEKENIHIHTELNLQVKKKNLENTTIKPLGNFPEKM